MPLFEYVCQACQLRFEAILRGSAQPACPACDATNVEKQFSAFAVGGAIGPTTSVNPGACGSCGDPRGPGACSLN